MRFQTLSLAIFTTHFTAGMATIARYGQCGGIGWSGGTVCTGTDNCVKANAYFSQCLPAPISVVVPASSSSSSLGSISTLTPVTTPTTTTAISSTSCDASGALSTGPPIGATTGAVYGLSLERDPQTGKAILTSGVYDAALSFGSSIYRLEYVGSDNCLTRDYLNIHNSTTSYKPLYWDYNEALTTFWGEDQTLPIQTTSTSPYGALSQFIACGEDGKWPVYLQTGTDVPPGVSCVKTQLKVL